MATPDAGHGATGSARRKASRSASLEIAGPRLTGAGVLLLLLYLGLPVAILGNLLDLLCQWWFGWCIGFWCLVN